MRTSSGVRPACAGSGFNDAVVIPSLTPRTVSTGAAQANCRAAKTDKPLATSFWKSLLDRMESAMISTFYCTASAGTIRASGTATRAIHAFEFDPVIMQRSVALPLIVRGACRPSVVHLEVVMSKGGRRGSPPDPWPFSELLASSHVSPALQ